MILMIFIRFKMELKVVNDHSKEMKTFNSIEEFDLFYRKYKDLLIKQTTQYLNKMYKIITPEGIEYKITKRNCLKDGSKLVQGDIYLKKIDTKNISEANELEYENIKIDLQLLRENIDERLKIDAQKNTEKISEITSKISDLEGKLKEVSSTLNQIVEVVNKYVLQTA